MKKYILILSTALLLAGCNNGGGSTTNTPYTPNNTTGGEKTNTSNGSQETSTLVEPPKDKFETLLSEEVIAGRDEKLNQLKSFKIVMNKTDAYKDGMKIVEKNNRTAEATFDDNYVPDYLYIKNYRGIEAGSYGEQMRSNYKTLYLKENEGYMGYSYGVYEDQNIDNSASVSYEDFLYRVSAFADTLKSAPTTRQALKEDVLKLNLNNEYSRVIKEDNLSTYIEEYQSQGYFIIGVTGTYKFDDEYMSLHTVNNYWFKFTYEGILLSARSDISISDTRYQKYTLDIKYDEDVAKQTPESIRN